MRDDAPYGLDDQQRPDDHAVLRRVRPSAIFLLVVSVVNLLAGIGMMVGGIALKKGGGDVETQMEKVWDDMKPEERDSMKQIGINSPHDFLAFYGNTLLYGGLLTALVAVLSVLGSVRMLSLHSYPVAVAAAVLTAIPCVTPCCLIGQIAGVWAFVMLMMPDVRKAFQ